jgi:glycosyltransferase involved in cell wall biosynthesis
MNVLHVVAGDLSGGAARGALWLHQGLLKKKVNSNILTNSKDNLNSKRIYSLSKNFFLRLKLSLLARSAEIPKLIYFKRYKSIFSSGFDGIDITKHQFYKNADIINFHWINGLVNVNAMKNISKPVVWTLRDMWPMTGGCHHIFVNCKNFQKECGFCPHLNSNKSKDLSNKIFQNKIKNYPIENLTVVGVSKWISENAKSSKIFENIPILTISNNVNKKIFFPLSKIKIRKKYNLPLKSKIIVVGAQDLTDYYKGFDLFLKSLNKIKTKNIHILTFGKLITKDLNKYKYTNLGYIENNLTMREIYSLADVYVSPSRIESFGKCVAEAMACGTPSVAFGKTGSEDIITHKIDGYIASYLDPSDLANGIDWILGYRDKKKISHNSIDKINRNFSIEKISSKYKKLYESILFKNKKLKFKNNNLCN